jgi:hypothetical protein
MMYLVWSHFEYNYFFLRYSVLSLLSKAMGLPSLPNLSHMAGITALARLAFPPYHFLALLPSVGALTTSQSPRFWYNLQPARTPRASGPMTPAIAFSTSTLRPTIPALNSTIVTQAYIYTPLFPMQ